MLTALRLFLWMTFLTGIAYPLLIFSFGNLLFNTQANGDFLSSKDKIVGAKLIGQKFENARYFNGRPSSNDFNGLNSGGSNLGPTSLALRERVKSKKEELKAIYNSENIPNELLFTSASGLDPHISLKAAYFQVSRIVKARNLEPVEGEKMINELIDSLAENNILFFVYNPYVNVLLLNIALDKLNN